jgi:hypothetical protein
MIERETLGFLLRSQVTPERVGAIVAAAFELPETEVAVLDYEKERWTPETGPLAKRKKCSAPNPGAGE